ncbi:transmembrane protein 26-like [Acanthaster planci]|uniref:Transmembrane protein 26-like n=1 Tax=Acanthaster planci TaxID=133434 RepID=A0A8B7ZWR4_ACAPL|nr:transmembrane protein 26-like [Acanthaster planci]XP_022109988.1 transmembrane protein 26-like [Acanthaster planci]
MTILSKSKAIFVRLLFGAHGTLAVIALVNITEIRWFYLAECLVAVSLLEAFVTLKVNKHAEWKWFLPSVFLYLLWIVPPIVLLESYAMDYRQFRLDMSENGRCFVDFNDVCVGQNGSIDYVDNSEVDMSNGVLDQTTYDEARHYALVFQQTMMLVLIGGRWLGPKGALTRDQLSQLLLALTGMAADMLEFVTETVKLEETACDYLLIYIILGIWAWSLLQFTLGLTATKQKKTRVVGPSPSARNPITSIAACCETEMWALMVSVVMQDGPYLTARLYIMFTVQNFGQTMIFFTAKNGILFLLQVYRLYVVIIERRRAGREGRKSRDEEEEEDSAFEIKEARTPTTPINGS